MFVPPSCGGAVTKNCVKRFSDQQCDQQCQLAKDASFSDDWKDFIKNGKLTPAGLDFLASRGYTGSLEWTYQEAMEFASLSSDNWEWVCQFTLMWERNACLAYNPFSPKIDGVALLKELSGLADAQRCKEYIFDDGESWGSCIWTAVNIVDYASDVRRRRRRICARRRQRRSRHRAGSHVLAASDESRSDDVVRTTTFGPRCEGCTGCSFGQRHQGLRTDGTSTRHRRIDPATMS